MKTIILCKSSLSKHDQEILAKHKSVRILLSECDGLDELYPVAYKLSDGVFYGQVTSNRLSDIIVGSADDIKIQTARLFDVTMGTYTSEPIYRKMLNQYYYELEELEEITSKTIEQSIQQFCTKKNISLDTLIAPLKLALIDTTKGPQVSTVIEALGKTESMHRINQFLKDYKNRI